MNNNRSKHSVNSSLVSDDLIVFNKELNLWLKPIKKININVQLPSMKNPGQCISTWQVMEMLKKRIKPYRFKNIKVTKSALDFIKFEAELESKSTMNSILARLDRMTLKLNGFDEVLKVKACKVKVSCTQHEWESFFRDNPHLNEMKPGLRPDTIYVQNLPVKWFGGERPNPHVLIKAFSLFGDIRRYHIPCLDEEDKEKARFCENFRQFGGGFKRFNFTESLSFDAFIMYRDYIGFVKAIDSLRDMKLVKKLEEINSYLEYDIKVDFDKSKHLSDKAIQSRQMEKKVEIINFIDDLKNESTKNENENKNENKNESQSQSDRKKCKEKIKNFELEKRKAKRLLTFLFCEIEKEMKKSKQSKSKQEKKNCQEKVKEKFLLEETKLRQKLIKRRKNQVQKNLFKSDHRLKSVNDSSNRNSNKNHKMSCKHQKPKSLVIAVENK